MNNDHKLNTEVKYTRSPLNYQNMQHSFSKFTIKIFPLVCKGKSNIIQKKKHEMLMMQNIGKTSPTSIKLEYIVFNEIT